MLRKYANGENKCCGRNWCVSDTCGIICGAFTWLLLFYGQFCVVSVMMASVVASDNNGVLAHQLLNCLLFETLFGLALAAHLKTMFTDPGTVRKGTLTEDAIVRAELEQQRQGTVVYKCTKCACIKPERAHHCSVCNRCIKSRRTAGMGWTITVSCRFSYPLIWQAPDLLQSRGRSSLRYIFISFRCFVLFTMYISLLSFHVLYWAIWQFVLCVNNDWHSCSFFSPATTTILLIFLLFESILFAIFSAVMLGTQLSAICSDQTGIESLKHERSGRKNERWKNLQVVFGGPFSCAWLNPLILPFLSEKSFEFSV